MSNQQQLGQDRRSAGRVPHRSQVLVRGKSATFRKGASCDLNEGGARLMVAEQLQAGNSLVLYLKLEAKRALSFLATVVWARPSEQGTEVGVRFEEGCHTDRRLLSHWLYKRRLMVYS